VIVDCISDLHGAFPELKGGDLLIVAGDLTARDRFEEYCEVFSQIAKAKYRKKIVVAGNHDNLLQTDDWFAKMTIDFDYLCDSGTVFEMEEPPELEDTKWGPKMISTKRKFKIWGSPWTKTFSNMNPHCKAFTVDTEEELASKFSLIPEDTNILITHSPVHGTLDKVKRYNSQGYWDPKKDSYEHVGSKSLQNHIDWDFYLQLHVCGHVHEGYGEVKGQTGIFSYHYVNCSIMNEIYEPINQPIRVEL
jgi:Icc-related predicted phosphoesterase